ncbi:hypothetical protein NA78x_001042 [Anatilimnocola sp. NA78]|uniref:hypothetical protein n=1 Tax=Anatilimnocola sp. NA78 TaxID=3415683 RepID=UPI003CE4C0D1
MSMMSAASETAIWSRVIGAEPTSMPPEAARYFLSLEFEPADLQRMHDLAVRNQQGVLSADEIDELKNFRQIGLQIDLLRSKARLSLRDTSANS